MKAIEDEFKGMGADDQLAQEIAWSVVVESRTAGINPWFMVAIIKVENPWLKADTVSFAGAIGITQVMPLHAGKWGCGKDLTDIRTNVCSGARIMASYLKRQWKLFGAEANRIALLNYNGCVRTPGCTEYASKVLSRTGFTDPSEVWQHGPPGLGEARLGAAMQGAARHGQSP